MSYEPENHLPILERYLEALHILTEAGFVAGEYRAYPQVEDGVEFGIPFAKGSDTYWLNAQSVQCVLQWSQANV